MGAEKLPEELTSRVTPQLQIYSSQSEDEHDDGPDALPEDVAIPLSKLNLNEDVESADQVTATSSRDWRSELAKIDVWYASFGSNMSESRFLCYIQGGQAEGMKRPCRGAADKNKPKEAMWKTVPHRLFFGRESTVTWGPGGVAFLNPETNNQEKTFMCLYRITLEQFNDVLLQENVCMETSSPFFEMNALDSIENEKSVSLEALKIANNLDRVIGNIGRKHLKVLVQVNTSGETFDPDGCVELVKHVTSNCPNLEFCGLMTIGMPDYTSTPENFKTLANCRTEECNALDISEEQCELE